MYCRHVTEKCEKIKQKTADGDYHDYGRLSCFLCRYGYLGVQSSYKDASSDGLTALEEVITLYTLKEGCQSDFAAARRP